MSHPRIRKAVVAGDGPQGRVPLAKASRKAAGDAVNDLNSIVCINQPPRARSKNKLPKSLRYDLENALVGLCDVWFENIKPHLIRNNIKLHVHEGAAAAEASGDHERLPPDAPGCSHLDPASSSGGCELCRLLSNAASSIESAVSQAASVARSSSTDTFTIAAPDANTHYITKPQTQQ